MRIASGLGFTVLICAVCAGQARAQGTPAGSLMGKFAITPMVGGNIPIQYLQQTDGGGRAEMGFLAGASGEYFFNDEASVGAQFGFDRFGMDVPDPLSGNWTILEFGAFARYVFTLAALPETRPFAKVGAMMAKAKSTIENGTEVETDIDPALGALVAGGVMHQVADNISIYGEVTWTGVATDGKSADVNHDGEMVGTIELEKHLQWVGVKVGATFFLGGE